MWRVGPALCIAVALLMTSCPNVCALRMPCTDTIRQTGRQRRDVSPRTLPMDSWHTKSIRWHFFFGGGDSGSKWGVSVREGGNLVLLNYDEKTTQLPAEPKNKPQNCLIHPSNKLYFRKCRTEKNAQKKRFIYLYKSGMTGVWADPNRI